MRPGHLFIEVPIGCAREKDGKMRSKNAFYGYDGAMRHSLRFLWNATRGHRLAPWRSPYLLWRIETYCGVKMTQIGFLEVWEFMWRGRRDLWCSLKWTGEMERYVHPNPKSS